MQNRETMKTNKSYLKRIKVTKNGKLVTRKVGQNHFNAKNRTGTTLKKRRAILIKMTNKDRGRYLNNA
jgi:ribosomal protein L35